MTTALVLTSHSLTAPPLGADLAAAGFQVCGEANCSNLLQEVLKKSTDIVVCFQETPDAAFFASLSALAASAPRPVVVFTMDPDAGKMATAMVSGVHAYVVAGYTSNRLRSVMHVAQARFRQEQVLRQELADLQKRFDERKLVDRAKGILMGARQLREEEAFRALRSAAMASKSRIGELSQTVIDRAHYAEAVNRAGQVRMLSQRIAKFYALACSGAVNAEVKKMFADSVAQAEGNLGILDRSLSKATFGDLYGAVAAAWLDLKAALKPDPAPARLLAVDRLAEHLLDHAETLTWNLEVAAFATALHPINVVGRQRMLIHRLAKEALIGTLRSSQAGQPGKTESGSTWTDLVAGLDYLGRLPLSNAEIAREMTATMLAWQALQRCLPTQADASSRAQIVASSEVLFGHFDRLTDLIERGVHALISE